MGVVVDRLKGDILEPHDAINDSVRDLASPRLLVDLGLVVIVTYLYKPRLAKLIVCLWCVTPLCCPTLIQQVLRVSVYICSAVLAPVRSKV